MELKQLEKRNYKNKVFCLLTILIFLFPTLFLAGCNKHEPVKSLTTHSPVSNTSNLNIKHNDFQDSSYGNGESRWEIFKWQELQLCDAESAGRYTKDCNGFLG